jgi:predicted ATPase
MDALMSAYASITDGQGRVAAITGEPGIGKTRLGEEVVERIRAGAARSSRRGLRR